ncbi:MAG: hypothetical protein ACREQ9_19060, partial [Candidatus Binatia bacterium]
MTLQRLPIRVTPLLVLLLAGTALSGIARSGATETSGSDHHLYLISSCGNEKFVSSRSVDAIGRAAEEQAHVPTPLRGDIRATIDGVEGSRKERMVMLMRNAPQGGGVETFLALGDAGLRYLVLADGTAFAAEKGQTKKVALDTPIDGTSWVLEDLQPFTVERCGVMRNVDESAAQITVLCNPVKGQK